MNNILTSAHSPLIDWSIHHHLLVVWLTHHAEGEREQHVEELKENWSMFNNISSTHHDNNNSNSNTNNNRLLIFDLVFDCSVTSLEVVGLASC